MSLSEDYKEALKKHRKDNKCWPQRLADPKFNKLSTDEKIRAMKDIGMPLPDDYDSKEFECSL